MNAREELRKLEETALEAMREARRIGDFYETRAKALRTALESCSDKQLEGLFERIKKECPSVVPS